MSLMRPQRIGVCHAPGAAANLRELFVAAREVCQVVLLVRKAVAVANPDLLALAGRLFECHTIANEPTAADVSGLDIVGVTTFHDDELDIADALDRVVRGELATGSPWDKLTQRKRLLAAGLGTVDAVAVDTADDLVTGFTKLGGGPCVLKPRRAAAGKGIAFIDDAAEILHQLAHRNRWAGLLLETRISPHRHPSDDPWLGDLISVETVTVGETRVHLGVLDKLPVAVARQDGPEGTDAVSVQGDILPSKLPADMLAAATILTGRALDLIGVGSRVTHTELRIVPTGLEVLEVNGRLAGHTARLFRLAGGPDLVEVALRAALRGPLGDLGVPDCPAAGLFPAFPARSGHVLSSPDARALRSIAGVAAIEDLAVAGSARADSDYRLANLTVTATNRDDLDRVIVEVLSALAHMFAADGVCPAHMCPGMTPRTVNECASTR